MKRGDYIGQTETEFHFAQEITDTKFNRNPSYSFGD